MYAKIDMTMKKIVMMALMLMAGLSLFAQEKKQPYSPKPGAFSIGITFNPMAAANAGKNYQPASGDYAGEFVKSFGTDSKQMFIMGSEPLAAFMLKYRMSEIVSLRANLGFTGSLVNYKEYVDDDAALRDNGLSQAKTTDVIHNKLNSVSLSLGAEFHKNVGAFQFNFGASLLWAVGGGSISTTYGNPLTKDGGWVRTTMPYLRNSADNSTLNQYAAADSHNAIANAYLVESYNQGYIHGVGLSVDMGVEWFCLPRVSIALSMTMTPIMGVFQPQTYSIYEGYSSWTDQVERYNKLVSPGSNAFLYGTDTFGFRFSLNYYL